MKKQLESPKLIIGFVNSTLYIQSILLHAHCVLLDTLKNDGLENVRVLKCVALFALFFSFDYLQFILDYLQFIVSCS